MAFLSDNTSLDKTTVAIENVTSEPLCNGSALAIGHSSNPYIPAWYLQVFYNYASFSICHNQLLGVGELRLRVDEWHAVSKTNLNDE